MTEESLRYVVFVGPHGLYTNPVLQYHNGREWKNIQTVHIPVKETIPIEHIQSGVPKGESETAEAAENDCDTGRTDIETGPARDWDTHPSVRCDDPREIGKRSDYHLGRRRNGFEPS